MFVEDGENEGSIGRESMILYQTDGDHHSRRLGSIKYSQPIGSFRGQLIPTLPDTIERPTTNRLTWMVVLRCSGIP